MSDVKGVAEWLKTLAVEEIKYLASVKDRVTELQDELDWMQCFLGHAEANQLDNAMAQKWVAQIREYAYEAEDMIESFLVNSRDVGDDLISKVKMYLRTVLSVYDIHKTGKNIDALKTKMSLLTQKLTTYGIQLKSGESLSSLLSKTKDQVYLTYMDEKLVGREVDMTILLYHLMPEEINNVCSSQPSSSTTTSHLSNMDTETTNNVHSSVSILNEDGMEHPVGNRESRVVLIHGIGGVGKTFIAKKIFHHPDIRRSYDAFAWASIPEPCQMSGIQQEILTGLTSKSRLQISQMYDEELADELRRVQRRKNCFVVLDGFWKPELWDQLKNSFPTTRGDFKTTILITTRDKKVAKTVHGSTFSHELKVLDEDQSTIMFKEKFGLVTDVSGEDVPDVLKKRMLKQCGGLPLAIDVLRGVLAKKRMPKEWEDLEKSFNTYLVGNRDEQPWKKILDLSYYELPFYLKPCFLYLGNFPINMELTTTKLCRLWEAEGLISSGDNEASGKTLENVAEICLAELLNRSYIHVASRDVTGRVKTCRLHEEMRKLSLEKASKVNWLSVSKLGNETDRESSGISRSPTTQKPRRLAIYCNKRLDKLPSDGKRTRYVRSLSFFNTLENNDFLIPLSKMALIGAFRRYKLIRVLDIENIALPSLPKEVGSLIYLKYLSLRGSCICDLPSSIKRLKFLQTLDLRVLAFVHLTIPNVLYELVQLVHLYLPFVNPNVANNEEPKLQLEGLVNLQTLTNFSCQRFKAEDLVMLTNLRTFSSVDYLSKESIKHLLPGSPLIHLEHISVMLDASDLSSEDYDLLAKGKAIHKLSVKKKIQRSIFDNFLPEDLYKLSLKGSKFGEDPMPLLAKLSNLKELSLEDSSYEGEKMTCPEDGFKKLQDLKIKRLEELKELIIEEKAMPKLFSLEINCCSKLDMIPNGLRSVNSLKRLKIRYMPISFFKGWTPVKCREEWGENRKIVHVPQVRISKVLALEEKIPN